MADIGSNASGSTTAYRVFINPMCRRESPHFNFSLLIRPAFSEDDDAGMPPSAVLRLHALQVRMILKHGLRTWQLCDHPARAYVDQARRRNFLQRRAQDCLQRCDLRIIQCGKLRFGEIKRNPAGAITGMFNRQIDQPCLALLNQGAILCFDQAGFQQRVRRANRGMTCKGKFSAWSEDANVVIRARGCYRDDEGRLRQVCSACDLLHLLGIKRAGVENDSHWISFEGYGSEDVNCFEGYAVHALSCTF